jgi:hypothetical protein
VPSNSYAHNYSPNVNSNNARAAVGGSTRLEGQGNSLYAASRGTGSAVSTNHALNSINSSHFGNAGSANSARSGFAGTHSTASSLFGSTHFAATSTVAPRLGGSLNAHGFGGTSGVYGSHGFASTGAYGRTAFSSRPFYGGYGYRGYGYRGYGWGGYGWRGGWGWGWGWGYPYWGIGWGWGWGLGWGWGWPGYWGCSAWYNPWWYGYPYGYYGDSSSNLAPSDNNYANNNAPAYNDNSDTADNGDFASRGYSLAPDMNSPAPSNQANGDIQSQAPAYAQNPNRNTPNVASSTPSVLIYLKDGSTFVASDYWLKDGVLHYDVNYGGPGTVNMDEVDLQRTVDENARRGVKFMLKPDPDPSNTNPNGSYDQQNSVPQSTSPSTASQT